MLEYRRSLLFNFNFSFYLIWLKVSLYNPQIMKPLMMAAAHSVYCGYNSVFAVMRSYAPAELDLKTHQEYQKEREAYKVILPSLARVLRGMIRRAWKTGSTGLTCRG